MNSIGQRWAMGPLVVTIAFLASACAPESGSSTTDNAAVAEMEAPRTQKWVSNIRVTTDCGVEKQTRSR